MLRLLSAGWSAGHHARRGLHRIGLVRTHALPVPVLSVGNLAVGGTGKTPFVAWLARRLRAARPPSRHPVARLRTRAARDAGGCRDEGAVLARLLGPDVPQVRGPEPSARRAAAARRASRDRRPPAGRRVPAPPARARPGHRPARRHAPLRLRPPPSARAAARAAPGPLASRRSSCSRARSASAPRRADGVRGPRGRAAPGARRGRRAHPAVRARRAGVAHRRPGSRPPVFAVLRDREPGGLRRHLQDLGAAGRPARPAGPRRAVGRRLGGAAGARRAAERSSSSSPARTP